MKSNFKLLFVAAFALVLSQTSFAQEEEKQSSFRGPSIHLAIGIRSKKAPDLDTYYSTVGGVKVSLFQLMPSDQVYFSFLAPGLQYVGYGIFAPSITPVIFNHGIGVGFALDFFPVRPDRRGGPLGLSFNFDIPKIAAFFLGR